MVYQVDNNSYLRGDRLKKYRLVVSCCLLFVYIELVEVITLEVLVPGV
jgi:hypothetical protein